MSNDRIEWRPETGGGLSDQPSGKILRMTGYAHAEASRQAGVYGRRTVEVSTPLTGGPLGDIAAGMTFTIEHSIAGQTYRWLGAEPEIDATAGMARFTLDIATAAGI